MTKDAFPNLRPPEDTPSELILEYRAYVKACHSSPGVFVSEFSFLEWIKAGKPKGIES